MLQTQRLAKQEFLEAFNDRWPKIVHESIVFNEPALEPAPAATEPADPTDPNSNDNPGVTDPSPIPQPKNHVGAWLAPPSWVTPHLCVLCALCCALSPALSAPRPNSFKITTSNLIQTKPLHLPVKSITFQYHF